MNMFHYNQQCNLTTTLAIKGGFGGWQEGGKGGGVALLIAKTFMTLCDEAKEFLG